MNLRRTGDNSTGRKISADALTIHVRPTTEVADRLKRSIRISVVDTPSTPVPSICSVQNIDDADIVNGGKSGQILHLIGSRLSFDSKNVESGVFVDCKVPDIAPGEYSFVVRTKPGKTIRSGSYKNRITIS